MMRTDTRLFVRPGEGQEVSFGGVGVVFKLSGEETGGLLSIVEHPVAPGALVPPHVHTKEDEYSYVLEGRVGVRIGDQEFTAEPGTYVRKPRGIPHTFWNAGPRPARLLEIICPAGLEQYFAELATLISAGGPPDFEKVGALQEKYGNPRAHPEWVAELTAKYNLRITGGGSREQHT
jgi:quercetin dioxygenase-like cupin family protein